MNVLHVRNRQKTRKLDTRLLRAITLHLIKELRRKRSFQLAVHIVDAGEIAMLNETFLRHEGPTDVITFDYSADERADAAEGDCGGGGDFAYANRDDRRRANQGGFTSAAELNGEIFVCMDEAVRQARRFRTTWQAELVRYVVHGILHMEGCDDSGPAERRKMKRKENRLVRTLRDCFAFGGLQRNVR